MEKCGHKLLYKFWGGKKIKTKNIVLKIKDQILRRKSITDIAHS